MSLPNSDVPNLPEGFDINAADWFVKYSVSRGILEKIKANLVTSTSNVNSTWVSTHPYDTDDVVLYANEFWASDEDGNVGNAPNAPGSTHWHVVSKSPSTLTLWQAGVYTEEETLVLHVDGGVPLIYRLDPDLARPYLSSDFDAEFIADVWQLVGQGPTIWGSITGTLADQVDLKAALDAKANLSGCTFTGAVILNADPVTALGAATKQYVDAVASGLDPKDSVRAATTGNITLSGAQTIDGVSVIAGDRVLVKDQSTGADNGIYVAAAGAWTRATDFVNPKVTPGAYCFVEEGTTWADCGFVLSTNGVINVGTTSLAFTQFSAAGVVTAGDGLTKTGQIISLGGTVAIGTTTITGGSTASTIAIASTTNTTSRSRLLIQPTSISLSFTNSLGGINGVIAGTSNTALRYAESSGSTTSKSIILNDTQMLVTDATDQTGLEYAADYSATWTSKPRAIPDIGKVAAMIAASGLAVGTSVINSGVATKILYDNAGLLGEYTISGTGNVAMTISPAFTTPNIGVATGTASGNWPTVGTYSATGAMTWVLGNNHWQIESNVTTGIGSNSGIDIYGALMTSGDLFNIFTNSLTSGKALNVKSGSGTINHTLGTNSLAWFELFGVNSTAGKTAIALSGKATNTGATSVNVGLYGEASGGTTNWSGYFVGNVNIVGGLIISQQVNGVGGANFSGTPTSRFSSTSNGIGGAAGFQSLQNSVSTGEGNYFSGNALTTGNIIRIESLSTTIDGGKLLNLVSAGANSTASKAVYGVYSAIANTGTTSTNVAGVFSATGATNNFALQLTGNIQNTGSVDYSSGSTMNFISNSGVMQFFTGGNSLRMYISSVGDVIIGPAGTVVNARLYAVQSALSSAWLPVFRVDPGPHTGITANVVGELPTVVFTGSTQTWAAGSATVATQRYNWFKGQTVNAGAGNTFTDTYNLYADVPVNGSGTTTRLWAAGFGGAVNVIGSLQTNGFVNPGVNSVVQINRTSSNTLSINSANTSGVSIGGLNYTYKLHIEPQAQSSAWIGSFGITAGPHTGLPTGTEYTDVYFNLSATATVAGSTTLTNNRTVRISPRTYTAATATTWAKASTFVIDGPPSGGGAGPLTITVPYSLEVVTGNSFFGGDITASNISLGSSALAGATRTISTTGSANDVGFTFDTKGSASTYLFKIGGTTRWTMLGAGLYSVTNGFISIQGSSGYLQTYNIVTEQFGGAGGSGELSIKSANSITGATATGDTIVSTGDAFVTGGAGSGSLRLNTGAPDGAGVKGRILFGAVANLKAYTVSTLPSGNAGDIAYVTDALAPTFLSIVVGGGAVTTPVFYNGANWVGF